MPGGGVLWRDHHAWLNTRLVQQYTLIDKGRSFERWASVPSMVGVPMYRVAGRRAENNAEFSIAMFVMPSTPLWLNANVSWSTPYDGLGGSSAGYQACVMVCVLVGGVVAPGFEKEKCVLMDVDGVQLPLQWGSEPNGHTSVLAGRLVSLRIYFRDSIMFCGRNWQ